LYTVQTKELAARNVFVSAATATDTVLTHNVTSSDPVAALPQPCSITRAANRYRTKNRPRHPKNTGLPAADGTCSGWFSTPGSGEIRKPPSAVGNGAAIAASQQNQNVVSKSYTNTYWD